jgi:hypothetical protein
MSVKRDKSLPRQSDLFSFIGEDEFEKIPEAILHNKAVEGIEKHDILEKTYGKDERDNLLAGMFKEGLQKIFTPEELTGKPVFEEQLNGPRFTGKPDFLLCNKLVDYKFTDILRPKTALQLKAYDILEDEVKDVLIHDRYAFHFPHDRALFIYKIPRRTIPELEDFVNFVVDNHEDIKAGKLVKYDALIKWEELQQDYTIFEFVAAIVPPMMITNPEEAITAARAYIEVKEAEKYGKVLKDELKRYLEDIDETRIEAGGGYGVRLQSSKATKVYDEVKSKAAKEVYNKALEDCLISETKNKGIVKFSPKKKKVKQIN